MNGQGRLVTVIAALTVMTTTILTSSTANATSDRLVPPSPARYAATHHHGLSIVEEDHDAGEIADRAEEFANQRIAPGTSVPAAAVSTALADGARLPVAGGQWQEVTGQPYQSEPAGYTDPVESNAGAGWGLVAGRITALAPDSRVIYAGTADGGVWRTFDNGGHWWPAWGGLGSQSVGAVLVDRAHRVWVGTGEANTSSDSYAGQGVYVSDTFGTFYRKVGGDEIDGSQIFRLTRAGDGTIFAATTHGLWRHSPSTYGPWQQVFAPDPNPTRSPYRTNFTTDVQVRGQTVLTTIGWRGGTAPDDLSYNGLYVSNAGGAPGSFSLVHPTGDLNAGDIGRTTLSWTGDGKQLWAIVQSPTLQASGGDTVLQGVFVSANGDPAGPWRKVGDSDSLDHSGSALLYQDGFHVGVQAWYNQAITVDPANPNHVYVSLEEVFETTDGGRTFQAAGPYWNLRLPCNPNCPQTTHPDQHALAVVNGHVWIGSDGGVWHRPLGHQGYGDWTNTNATLHNLQYYGAGTGSLPGGRTAYWGGLQDNGTSVLLGRNASTMIQPAGGDGGQVLVDPRNGNNSVGEYVNLAMYVTTDGGHTFRTISPVCGGNPDDPGTMPGCDPTARFIAPFTADVTDPNHWVAGGEFVWDDHAAWTTRCHSDGCDWKNVHDLGKGSNGAPRLATALTVNGSTTYAGWVAGGGNPGPAFASGIDTNYGGTWHTVTAPNLPQRFLASLRVDPHDAGHVYAVYSGYSRHWIPGGGVGHVFESRDGGAHWTDISGNLPDTPGDDLVFTHGKLVLATDTGMFVADADHAARWSRLGVGLPGSVVNGLALSPNGNAVVAATHGRGLWQLSVR
ncbi:WD40/YVTN/BNR-like repeat-containing protein [Actinocrispum wychmicini]|uniref:Glycosyl hydrolase n=1 Tax=Actinocrispum wychmicini TaxID=1213861 RepID=A0A4R2K2A8_9PSEU|nr:glycosyl hydrolase [Actinocrispum wychmicini]TCO60435.1 hypothetical protein EV192_10310 [Actinocrispum wychmicini]